MLIISSDSPLDCHDEIHRHGNLKDYQTKLFSLPLHLIIVLIQK